ncbi:MAG: nodulation protein NfeD [Pseudomonadota bacterium]
MKIKITSVVFALGLMVLLSGSAPAWADESGTAAKPAPLCLIRLEGAIGPGAAGFLESSIHKASEEGAQALIVELDTPGGLVQAMRSMVKAIMNAPLPIIVYVAPSGAQAASAGVMITLAADIAAMAPGTNIGAAHPVGAGGQDISGEMEKKVLNDMTAFIQGIAKQRGRNEDWAKKSVERSISVISEEALILGVIDLVAADRKELLAKLEGRKVERAGLETTIHTLGAELIELEETLRDKLLRTLSDPNISYILMMIGLAGLYFEFSHPGAILPGVVGGISLLLAFYSFQTLPVNYTGILLIIFGIILFFLEIKIASYGALSIGGLICLTLGSLMLFKTSEDYARVSWNVMLPVLLGVGGFFVGVTGLVVRAQKTPSRTGGEGMTGLGGSVKHWGSGQGKVFVHGEWWSAVSEDDLAAGDEVVVLALEGLKLIVKRKPKA